MIFGSGNLVLIASSAPNDGFPDFYYPPCYANFAMVSETELSNAKYLSLSGVQQTKSNQISGERFFVELTFENTDFMTVQLILGELSAAVSEVYLDEYVTVCPLIDVSFNDNRITEDQSANIGVYNLTEKNVMLQVSDINDLVPNRFFVNSVGKLIAFDTSQLGQALSIKIPTFNEDIGCLGGFSSRGELLNYSFEGRFNTTANDGDYIVQIPHLRRIAAPSFDFIGGDKVTVTVRYEAVSGSDESTERKPFRIFSPNSGVS